METYTEISPTINNDTARLVDGGMTVSMLTGGLAIGAISLIIEYITNTNFKMDDKSNPLRKSKRKSKVKGSKRRKKRKRKRKLKATPKPFLNYYDDYDYSDYNYHDYNYEENDKSKWVILMKGKIKDFPSTFSSYPDSLDIAFQDLSKKIEELHSSIPNVYDSRRIRKRKSYNRRISNDGNDQIVGQNLQVQEEIISKKSFFDDINEKLGKTGLVIPAIFSSAVIGLVYDQYVSPTFGLPGIRETVLGEDELKRLNKRDISEKMEKFSDSKGDISHALAGIASTGVLMLAEYTLSHHLKTINDQKIKRNDNITSISDYSEDDDSDFYVYGESNENYIYDWENDLGVRKHYPKSTKHNKGNYGVALDYSVYDYIELGNLDFTKKKKIFKKYPIGHRKGVFPSEDLLRFETTPLISMGPDIIKQISLVGLVSVTLLLFWSILSLIDRNLLNNISRNYKYADVVDTLNNDIQNIFEQLLQSLEIYNDDAIN